MKGDPSNPADWHKIALADPANVERLIDDLFPPPQ